MGFHEEDNDSIRSSRLQMFFKIGGLKYFAIFTGKQSCKPDGLLHRPEKLLHRYFPVKIVKFLRAPFLQTCGGCFFIILLLLVA